jgi:hypothetical protein
MSQPTPATPHDPQETERRLSAVEATLFALLGQPDPAAPPPSSPARGRPPVLPAALLWAGLLVCLLRGLRQQADVWRLLAVHGLWHFPRVEITQQALYDRLWRLPPTAMAAFFTQITALLRARYAAVSACALAPFAAGIYAIDHTILDPVLRRRKVLREWPKGDVCLLPGALGCVFNLRTQLWERVEYVPDPQQDLHQEIEPLVQDLPPESLLLFDLGYFAFWWLDQLAEAGYWYVTRLREKVTFIEKHVFYAGGSEAVQLWDGLIYLGKYRADRAAFPVRLIRLTVRQGSATRQYRYLTNVLDPRLLPASAVVGLYRRRWDIEQGFDLVKTHLGLHLLWSSVPQTLLQQVYGTFIIAQIVLALRTEIAVAAGADLREVSLELLVRWLPQLLADGREPMAEFVAVGRRAGYIRPCRPKEWSVPEVPWEAYAFPEHPPPHRKPRYGGRDYLARTYVPSVAKQQKRARCWDFDVCRRTV